MSWFVKIVTFEQCLDLRNINWIFYCLLKWPAYQNETEATLGEIGIGRKKRQENICNQYVIMELVSDMWDMTCNPTNTDCVCHIDW